ncbi:peptidoglycan-associated lipoprotein Pal [Hydrogenovibrio sp. 3SP14C1]|uniref:peptidoglycan-associated lipoprotein Pal n=1 Tax=Hydrogenovibrio sp. 3SP14C1 TaxID=3038774 RepID=UPI0024168BAF|nr:peptidoglycan-associated lipoprotein Pal [Hydrogenovibrio sp. 3SP14C1]MDG4813519.1 peptidoglycan-associated lipoprotein Pal [Hydrogenovibrio sp. 3SP14C1]
MNKLKLLVVLGVVSSLAACTGAPKKGEEADMNVEPVSQEEVDYAEKARLELEKANSGEVNEVEVLGTGATGSDVSSEELASQDLNARSQEVPSMGQTFEPVIYFGYDQYIVDDSSMEIVKHYATILVDNPSEKIQLVGHTDERGTPEYNLALGERRAKAVAEAFMLYGVSKDRIEVISLGEELPLMEEHNEEAWAKNRRVEIKAQ